MSAKPVFLAGAATANITPWLGYSVCGGLRDSRALHIHDDLFARCLVLDDGVTRLAFAIVDTCVLDRNVIAGCLGRLQEQPGIPASHVLIAATHTHSGGSLAKVFQSCATPEYQEFVARRIADGIRCAHANRAPARIGWGSGAAPEEVFNRRWRLKPEVELVNPLGGRDQVKMNPGVGNPDLIEPVGPTDPELFVISVTHQDGRPLALLANYSLHYVGGVGPGHISADYFGVFARRLETLLQANGQDPPFVAMMSNGTSGDINNIQFRGPAVQHAPYQRINQVAERVVERTMHIREGIEHHAWVPLAASDAQLLLGVRKPSKQVLERARKLLPPVPHPGDQYTTAEMVYARGTLDLSRYPRQVPVPVQALRIGEIGIAAVPCEVFAETGLEWKRDSPLRPMFTISLANGYNGYAPPPRQHALGGYETWPALSSYLEVAASDRIGEAVLALLGQVR